MAQRFYFPREQTLTNLGAVGIGWRLFTYKTGTTTPKTTYSNTALTSANANPASGATTGNQVSDSSGRFGDIFVGNLADYKAVLKDDLGNTIWTTDPVDPKTFTLADFDPAPVSFWGTTTGTSTAYQLAADPTQTAYSSNSVFYAKFYTACGASPALNIDGLGTLNLKKRDGAGTKVALEANDVLANYKYAIENDGTDLVVLMPEKPYFGNFQATESYKGIAEIATQAEVNTGTNDTTIVTPLKLKTSVYNSMELISTAIASSSASISFTNLSSIYSKYMVLLNNVIPANNGAGLIIQFSTDNGSTYLNSAYESDGLFHETVGVGFVDTQNNATRFTLVGFDADASRGISNSSTKGGLSGSLEIFNPSSTTQHKILGDVVYPISGADYLAKFYVFGRNTGTTAVDAIRFKMSTSNANTDNGNITSGTFKLYGIK
tara:strand:+ start:4043 stop:5344 length:1302 start_codon:yes stop_codon:yes gene_type:complete